ncbi:ABC transporter permease [Alcaligenes endophyticus]|uniref:ABC transporter permease n=1 Tax=Alcaligenes endophyticus TaxID=1929088 RepID=A0ABT8EJM2_9BURK|nr:ABC transporter permease [Alcaligenes endophyticus]MCX5591808.1 ABC transporter permease [Alcaligenes endophyticus]MDN4121485.1 ABC transporter permease [Alcaligenes endophyticus]
MRLSVIAKVLALPVVFFVCFFLVPLSVVLMSSLWVQNQLSFEHYLTILLDQYHWSVIWVTIKLGIYSTLICALLGYPLAWFMIRIVSTPLWRRLLVILLIVPLFTSNIVRSFGWMVLLGRTGFINETLQNMGLIERPIRFLGTELGILIGLVYILLPFMVISVGASISRIDRSLEYASRDLGAGHWETFRYISLPLTLPGLAAGSIMVFALSVSAYVTPALLSGGRVTVLPMLIYQQYSTVFNFSYGGALSIVLLLATLFLVAFANRLGSTKGGDK